MKKKPFDWSDTDDTEKSIGEYSTKFSDLVPEAPKVPRVKFEDPRIKFENDCKKNEELWYLFVDAIKNEDELTQKTLIREGIVFPYKAKAKKNRIGVCCSVVVDLIIKISILHLNQVTN